MNGRDQSTGRWEVPANRGFLSRIKNMFSHSEGEKKRGEEEDPEDNLRGNEWLLEGENEANSNNNMRSESNDDIGAFGEEKCNSVTEALDYLARLKKTSSSEIARSLLERPISGISATFQILLNLQRQNSGKGDDSKMELDSLTNLGYLTFKRPATGIYFLDHTVPGWPSLASESFMAFMNPASMKRLRISATDVRTSENLPSGLLQGINWWWCPLLLKSMLCRLNAVGSCVRIQTSCALESFNGQNLNKRPYHLFKKEPIDTVLIIEVVDLE
ncbi:hypothetical protein Aperf_G00000112158 [Anoplocephala perfoliata]